MYGETLKKMTHDVHKIYLPSSINKTTNIERYCAALVELLMLSGTFSGLSDVPPSRALINASTRQPILSAAIIHANKLGNEQKAAVKNKECVDSGNLIGSPRYSFCSF